MNALFPVVLIGLYDMIWTIATALPKYQPKQNINTTEKARYDTFLQKKKKKKKIATTNPPPTKSSNAKANFQFLSPNWI